MAGATPQETPPTTWVLVVSLEHARRGVAGGFVMANHGKRPPLARMVVGDGLVVYSPTTTYPKGRPLRAVTVVGTATGTEPEPNDVIPGGFRRRAALREIEPLPLDRVRDCLPTSRLRFGAFALPAADADVLWARIADQPAAASGGEATS